MAHRVAVKMHARWSPEQIADWLKQTYPNNEDEQASHETITAPCAQSLSTLLAKQLQRLGLANELYQSARLLESVLYGCAEDIAAPLNLDECRRLESTHRRHRNWKCLIPTLPRPQAGKFTHNVALR
jgi:hypothetical protein